MKILYSHRTLSADGQHVHIDELTTALKARGCTLVMAGPGGAGQERGASGQGLRGLLPGALYECAEYGYSFPAYWCLRALQKAERPDILYERYNLFYHAGVWLKRKAGLPMLLEVNAPLAAERATHGKLSLQALAGRSERAIWRAADMVLPVSGALADHVRAAGVPEDRIAVIPNGVSAAFLSDIDPRPVRERYGLEGKVVLGFAGFVREWHGVDRVIRFLAKHRNSNLHFLMIGDGPARPGLEAQAAELGVMENTTFAGAVRHEDLPAAIAAFDIALLPASTPYSSPLKLFEYMALGKAVIANDGANIREVLTDGEDALLFGEDDSAFDKGLLALVEDADLRVRLGEAARAKLIRRDYSWAGNARRVEGLAAGLLERRP